MSVFDDARADWERFSQEASVKFVSPSNFEITVLALATKHNVNIDTDGQIVNTKNVHVTVSEALLVDYPVRINGEVAMHRHKVYFSDSNGVNKKYYVIEHHPDETTGVITFILGESE